MAGRTERRRVLRITGAGGAANGGAANGGAANGGGTIGGVTSSERADLLAAEEPLGIRVGGQALAMTMRTPGDDLDLVAGFLVGEGIARSPGDIRDITVCSGERCGHAGHEDSAELGNVADVTLAPEAAAVPLRSRGFLTTSACGVCGKTSIAELSVSGNFDLSADHTAVTAAVLAGLPDALRAAQRVFDRTGGLHAAGLFTAAGELLAAREDVGRHNAVDKIVGWALRAGALPLSGCVLLVSGRASFELVQKAVLAGIPVLAAVSAPSSLAAGLAQEAGLTLVGFLRGGSMNVYTAPERVVPV
jgi:FdhD protein